MINILLHCFIRTPLAKKVIHGYVANGGHCLSKTPVLDIDRGRCRFQPSLLVKEDLKCSGFKKNNFHFLRFKVLQCI